MTAGKINVPEFKKSKKYYSLQRSPRPPSWILGGLLLREGKGREGRGRGGEGREGRGKGRGPPAFPLHPQPLHSR